MAEFFFSIIGFTAGTAITYLVCRKKNKSGPLHEQLNTIQSQLLGLTEVHKQSLERHRDIIELQSILKIPKSRGIYGELLLEEQLAQLPPELFKTQFRFKNGNICDAVLCLQSHMLAIDSKFSLENFQKMVNATTHDEGRQHEKNLYKDIKNRINEIKEKYILPNEGTLNFALMYIPAENVYYHTFIKNRGENGLYDYAYRNNVYPISPNLLYPYFEIILFGLRGLKIEANAHKIHQGLIDIQNKLTLFGKSYRKAQEQLRNAQRNLEEGDDYFTAAQNQLKLLGYYKDLPEEKQTT